MKKRYKIKNRRSVEIYFVLYLAALVFLIPKNGNHSGSNNGISSMELPFSIKPEKSVLFCRMAIDSVPLVLHLDSTNTIYHTGEINNIKYGFVVEDQVYKQKISLAPDLKSSNRFFSVRKNTKDESVFFKWQPPMDDHLNKSYLVYVTATGNLKSNNRQVTARSQFTLIINYYDKETGMPIVAQEPPIIVENLPDNTIEVKPNLSDFNLSLRYDYVQTIAYQEWENQIFILGGLNPLTDLLKNPDISITHNPENNGGSVYISNYFTNGIVLKGKSPAYGSIDVKVTLKRRFDNKEAGISFKVSTLPIGNPEIATEMYPGLAYRIKPNLPFIAGQETKAQLKEGDRIRAQSPTGEDFSFTPQLSDTGKVLIFERYINNNIIGQRYKINIESFPVPAIVKLTKIAQQTVLLQTNAYGYHNTRENTVSKLEISGNGTFQERFGQYKADRNNNLWTQYFEIVPKDNSKPFTFKVKAIDRRGVASEVQEYGE